MKNTKRIIISSLLLSLVAPAFAEAQANRKNEKSAAAAPKVKTVGDLLNEAVEFCRTRGLEFYAVNNSYPEEEYTDEISRKVNADIFIDDRNFGGVPGWGEIYQELCLLDSEKMRDNYWQRHKAAEKRTLRGLIKRIFSLH